MNIVKEDIIGLPSGEVIESAVYEVYLLMQHSLADWDAGLKEIVFSDSDREKVLKFVINIGDTIKTKSGGRLGVVDDIIIYDGKKIGNIDYSGLYKKGTVLYKIAFVTPSNRPNIGLYERKHIEKQYTVNENREYTEFEKFLLKRNSNESEWGEIKEINCSNQKLKSIEGIENLRNLERLYCYNNNLTTLKDIKNLTNLRYLYCSNNNLTSLEGIENLRNLERLYCSINKITSLNGIENLRNLKELHFRENKISSIKEIKNLNNLKEIGGVSSNMLPATRKFDIKRYCDIHNIIIIE